MGRLFERLFGRQSASGQKSSLPAGTVVYAIGDIHGRFDLLSDLLDRICVDRRSHPSESDAALVFLGDYVDRGLDSRRVVDFLSSGVIEGFRTVFLKGNHEQAMLDFLDGADNASEWLSYGGLETLYAYGVQLKGVPSSAAAMGTLRSALHDAVPSAHVDFMRACRLTHTEGDYLFVHAGVRPGIPLARQVPSDLLWIRDDFLQSRGPFEGKVIVHGHTICDRPQNRSHRINIDTGAFISGHLTAVVLHGQVRRFLATGVNDDVDTAA
jgi:serine/threonine protein phosphatase 1